MHYRLCSRDVTIFVSVELITYHNLGHDNSVSPYYVKDAIQVKERLKKLGFSTVLSDVTSGSLNFCRYTLRPVYLIALPSFASSTCDDMQMPFRRWSID
jgi:hypothetical protein